MKKSFLLFLTVILVGGYSQVSHSQSNEKTTMGASGYPLPRFMTLVNDETNMRTGPGLEYPIDWIYRKEDYPLKVIAEYGNWRKIMDVDGSTGWIARHLLSLDRQGLIINGPQNLVKSPGERNIVTLVAEQDVLGTIIKCEENWCFMEISGFNGWIREENLWGVLDGETFD